MQFNRLVATAAVAMSLAGCAGMGRMESYPHGFADAKVVVGRRHYSVWFHRADSTVMIQRGMSAGMGQALAEGFTLNAVNMTEPMPYWKAAAAAVLNPLGCSVGEVYTLDNRTTWEAHYTCPPGTDVNAAVQAHRLEWRQGIAVADPMSGTP